MLATVVTTINPYNPTQDRTVKTYSSGRRISTLAPKTELPLICIVNGSPLLRKDGGWEYRIKDGDVVGFQTLPQGGGGSNPLKLVLTIAIAIFAPYAAGWASGTFGLGLGTTGLSVLGAAISFAGSLLVNALLPPPKPPSSSVGAGAQAPSPTYNIRAQGNRARINESIPVLYGRHLIFPDFAAEPYTEYSGNTQFLYQLFCIGQGHYELTNFRLQDTPIDNFPGVSYEVVNPGDKITLFPSNVITANEVSGQELFTNVAEGPYVASPSSTKVTQIGVDITTPAGLYYANDDGGLDYVATSFRVEAREIDNEGAAVGVWTVLGNQSIGGATSTQQRRTYKYSVSEGRYEVRVTRTDTKRTAPRYGHTLAWEALKGYVPDDNEYGALTLVAIRMQASDSLSSQSARRFNLKAERKLPVWNGTEWSAPTKTRSIAWALADICRADYGARYPDSRINLSALLSLDSTWSSREDYFDGIFDQKIVIWEALDIVARAGRAKRFMQNGIVQFTRDEASSVPMAMFNMRNIKRGSLKVDYLVPSDETADHVIVSYFDETLEKPIEVSATLPGSTVETPAKVDLFGVTNRAQAWREGMYMAAANRYRRQMITFTTEMEGFIPTYGNLISVSHERLQRSVSGELMGYDSGTKIITLSEPVEFGAASNYYVSLRKSDGSYSGPWEVTEGADNKNPVLVDVLDFTPVVGNEKEKTHFAFGEALTHNRLCRVLSVKPIDLYTVNIACINEDDAVHTADTGTVPPESIYWNLPGAITRPSVNALSVVLAGTPGNPKLFLNWTSVGAERYIIETSYDGALTWQRVAEVTSENALVPAQAGQVQVRVAARALTQGNWTYWSGNPYAIPPANVSSFLAQVQPDGTRQFTMEMSNGLPADFAGYEIRYKIGTGSYSWEDLTPVQEGIVTASPWESNQLEAGTYTFAVKAVDMSGNKSVDATFLVADLADQRLAGVIYSKLPRNNGWNGAKTGCYVEKDTGDLAPNDTTTWDSLPTWDDWDQWTLTPESSISYEDGTIDLGANVSFVLSVSAVADGAVTIEERHSDDDVTYSAWSVVDSQALQTRYVQTRITAAGSFPRITSVDIKLGGQGLSEEINDLDTSLLVGDNRIGVGDIRLPYSEGFSTISQIQVSLQSVTGGNWTYVVEDKEVAIGPRIKIYNGGVLADAVIDVFMRGY